MKTKRVIIATSLGVGTGFICCMMAKGGDNEIPIFLAVNIILGRTLTGFGIGISRFKMKHWALHGLIMGFIFSLPMAFGALLAPETPEFSHQSMFIATMLMGVVYGFLIEFITSVLFKARQ